MEIGGIFCYIMYKKKTKRGLHESIAKLLNLRPD